MDSVLLHVKKRKKTFISKFKSYVATFFFGVKGATNMIMYDEWIQNLILYDF